MSAAGSLGTPDRSADQRAHEPSMEEILASIRRIIADDQASLPPEPAPVPPAEPTALPPPPLHDRSATQRAAFVRPEREAAPEAPPPPPDAVAPRPPDVPGLHMLRPTVAPEPAPEPAPPPPREPPVLRAVAPLPPKAPEPLPEPAMPDLDAPLISAETDAAVTSSFNALLASHLMQNEGMIADLTRELLRPMLKAWLDDNLPIIVERLVRAEIERVARGGR